MINIENYYQVPLSKSGISKSSEIIDHLSELDRPNLIGIFIFCIIKKLIDKIFNLGFFDHTQFNIEYESNLSFRDNLSALSKNPSFLTRDDYDRRIRVSNPRYHLAANFNPHEFYLEIKNERKQIKFGGVLHKFAVSVPCLPLCTAIRQAPECVQIQSILFLITMIHKSNQSYSLSPEAINLFNKYSEEIREQCILLDDKDLYLKCLLFYF